jgi:hypothetical protein
LVTIYDSKAGLRLLPPERVREVRELEVEVSALRGDKGEATLFQKRHGLGPWPFDDVAAWAATTTGGRQLQLLAPPPDGGCLRWGLCEPPGAEREGRDEDEVPL